MKVNPGQRVNEPRVVHSLPPFFVRMTPGHWGMVGIAIFYLVIVTLCSLRTPFIMDEFASAWSIEQLLHHIPYRDHQPYKTVLGTYAIAPVLAWEQRTWEGLVACRLFLGATVALGLLFAGFELLRKHSAMAVCLGLFALTVQSNFLEHSAAIRVDMLTAMTGAASLLMRLRGRHRLAALLAGISFFVSQKGLYFIVAFAAAELALAARKPRRDSLSRLIESLVFGAIPAVVYLVGFGLFSTFSGVFRQVFLKPVHLAVVDHYENMSKFWWQSLSGNLAFYLAAALSLSLLLWSSIVGWKKRSVAPGDEHGEVNAEPATPERHLLLGVYAATVFFLCAMHKQPWPYFFVLLLPTAAVAIVEALDLALAHSRRTGLVLAGILFCGSLAQGAPRFLHQNARNNADQETAVRFAESLMGPEDTYFAGIPFLRHRQQPTGLEWLDGPRLGTLRESYHEELALLTRSPTRLLIWNYRLSSLPPVMKKWLSQHYYQAGANVALPKLKIASGESTLTVKQATTYRVVFEKQGTIEIDGRRLEGQRMLRLDVGDHTLRSTGMKVLLEVPMGAPQMGTPVASLFAGIYD